MEKKNQTFQEVMQEILTLKKATGFVIKKFEKDTNQVEIPFQAVVDAIKLRETRNW